MKQTQIVNKYNANRVISESAKVNEETPHINYVRKLKHFPPSNKEWLNSVYTYNGSATKNLPYFLKSLSKLVEGYFSLYSTKLKKMVKKCGSRPFEIKKIRKSIQKILVGKAELKHTNSKTIITLYIYNPEKNLLINKIKKIQSIYESGKFYINKTSKASLNLKFKLQSHRKKLCSLFSDKNLKLDNIFINRLRSYELNYTKNYIRKFLRREIVLVYYKQLLAFNKNKFENRYVLSLANQIKKIYNKNVEFNFVNLKHLYLDNYIFSSALITKIKNLARVKRSHLLAMKKFLNMFKIPRFNAQDIYNEIYKREKIIQNFDINNIIFNSTAGNGLTNTNEVKHSNKNFTDNTKPVEYEPDNSDILDKSLRFVESLSKTGFDFNLKENKRALYTTHKLSKLSQVLKSTKYKFLNGVRLELAGRLTRRSSAARSIFKIRNKGNVRNVDSSDKGLSAVILKGYAKSNLQHNKLHSKVRGGSFGLKGWLSGS